MDPSVLEPATFDLGIVLTAAGIPVAAGIIASLIQIAKRIPGLGAAIDSGEAVVNIGLSAVFVVYAALAIHVQLTAISGFMLFLAWVNLAGFTAKIHDSAPEGLRTALSGKS